jgi:DNA-nicking Smr family endonuclease
MNFADILSQWEQNPEHLRVVRKDDALRSAATEPPLSPRRLPIEASIDLHGKTQEETLVALDRFVGECRGRGLRKILVVHGKGIHSDDEAVLQKAVQTYIEGNPHLGTWGHPSAKDGGSGATWVVIKAEKP